MSSKQLKITNFVKRKNFRGDEKLWKNGKEKENPKSLIFSTLSSRYPLPLPTQPLTLLPHRRKRPPRPPLSKTENPLSQNQRRRPIFPPSLSATSFSPLQQAITSFKPRTQHFPSAPFSFSPQPRPADPAHSIFFIYGHHPAIGIFGSQNQKPHRGLLFPVEAAAPRLNTAATPAVFFSDGVSASTSPATHRPADPTHQTTAASNLFVPSNRARRLDHHFHLRWLDPTKS